MPVRQDQKPAVVGQPFQPVVLMAEAPADPTVTGRTFQGGGGKTEDGNPLITKSGDMEPMFRIIFNNLIIRHLQDKINSYWKENK